MQINKYYYGYNYLGFNNGILVSQNENGSTVTFYPIYNKL